MHVCDLTTLYVDAEGGGGVNTYLIEKARYLGALGVSHSIVVPGEQDARTDLHGARLYRIKSPRLPWNRQHRVLVRLREVQRILRREAPTVVEVDCAYLLGRAAARALRHQNVPIVGFYHVHLPAFVARSGPSALRRGVSRLAERLAWRYVQFCTEPCDRIVVASAGLCRGLQGKGFKGVECAPLGVNTRLFVGTPAAGARTQRPLVLLHVGRLSHEKDIDVLIRAHRLLAGRGDYQLRIVGDGPLRGRLQRMTNGDPRVVFLGPRPYGEELARLYASADLFVNPSPNETFSLALLEAAACGLPVVAAESGGPRDLVSEDIGVLARPGDAADFAAKIEATLASRERYARGRERVERDYSWHRCFERLLDVYRMAIGERQARSRRADPSGAAERFAARERAVNAPLPRASRGVLVTGATGTLGQALVRAFAAAGYFIGIHYHEDRDAAAALLASTAGTAGGDLLGADLTAAEPALVAGRDFLRRHPHVDVLVNNAGHHRDQLFGFVEPAAWRAALDVNLGSLYPLTHCFVRARIPHRSGAIINISSVSGLLGLAGQVAYAAAKSGVHGFTRALAREVGGHGLRVNAIAPGAIDSPAVARLPDERRQWLVDAACLRRLGRPAEIAAVAVFLASQEASFVTGQVIAVDGGIA